MEKCRVFIGKIENSYNDIDEIAGVISKGMENTGLFHRIKGKVLLKPNLVMVDKKVARSCFTRPEVLHAFLRICVNRMDSVFIVENSGRGAPTYRMMQKIRYLCPAYTKGYYSFEDLYPGKVHCAPIEEGRLFRYHLQQGETITFEEKANPELCKDDSARFYTHITTSAHYADSDCVVYMPKLKSNVVGNGLTGALKLGGIGNLTDAHRMEGHNDHNSRRIVDMLEVAFPDVVITDAIEASVGGNQMTQHGKPLGAVMVADNPVAHDVVAAHILHLSPENIPYIRMAVNRGYGPGSLDGIEIYGDFSLEELQDITRDWDLGLIRVDSIPEKVKNEHGIDFKPEIIAAEPYSIPGTQGVFLDWFYMSYDYEATRKKISSWPEISIVMGDFREMPHFSKVVLVGNHAISRWKSLITSSKGVTFPDWFQSYLGFPKRIERYSLPDRKGWAFHIQGDPPAHKDMILSFFLASWGKMRASLFRFTLIADTYLFSLKEILMKLWNNRKGIPEIKPKSRNRYNSGARDETR